MEGEVWERRGPREPAAGASATKARGAAPRGHGEQGPDPEPVASHLTYYPFHLFSLVRTPPEQHGEGAKAGDNHPGCPPPLAGHPGDAGTPCPPAGQAGRHPLLCFSHACVRGSQCPRVIPAVPPRRDAAPSSPGRENGLPAANAPGPGRLERSGQSFCLETTGKVL